MRSNLLAMRLLLLTALLFLTTLGDLAKPSFSIDWEGDRFVKDGQTFQYASAGMHYFRIPHQYWAQRWVCVLFLMLKWSKSPDKKFKTYLGVVWSIHRRISAAKSAGLNAVTTYVAWNEHEHTPGSYKFSGQQDLIGWTQPAFMDIVQCLQSGQVSQVYIVLQTISLCFTNNSLGLY